MFSREDELSELEIAIFKAVGSGELELKVTSPEGKRVFITTNDSDDFASVMHRVNIAGGYLTLFSLGASGRVRSAAVIPTNSALFAQYADDMTAEPPNSAATIGMFLDYLETQEHGVVVPALAGAIAGAGVREVSSVENLELSCAPG